MLPEAVAPLLEVTDPEDELSLSSSLAHEVKNYFPDLVIKEDDYTTDFDNRNYIVSNDKLESFGWKPKYSIGDGIKELIDAYKMIIKHNNRNFTNL